MSEFYLRMIKSDTEKMQRDLSRIADSLEKLTALFEKEFESYTGDQIDTWEHEEP